MTRNCLFFFFSSRRRHTRSKRDWSSDVCSSDLWDTRHHPSYKEVWDRVVPETRDPYVARERYEHEFATRPDYIEAYRRGFGFHGVHPIMAMFPLKRLKHAGTVLVAGADD